MDGSSLHGSDLFRDSDRVEVDRGYSAFKHGDRYLRTLLIHGARAVMGRIRGKQDQRSLWLLKVRERHHANVVAVALANKNARIAWSLLASGLNYDQRLTVNSASAPRAV